MSDDTKTKSTNKILLILFLTILSVSLILSAGIHLQIYAKKLQSNHSSSSNEMNSISNLSKNTLSNKNNDSTNGINVSQIIESNLINDSNCKHSDIKSCYNSGYFNGKLNPGPRCLDRHSKTYCNGYNTGSKSEDSSDKLQDKSTGSITDNSNNIAGFGTTDKQTDSKDKNEPILNSNKTYKTNDITNIINNQGISHNIIFDKVNKTKSNFDPKKLSTHKSKNGDPSSGDNDSKNKKQSIQRNLNPLLSNNTSDDVQSKFPTSNNTLDSNSKSLSHKIFNPSLTSGEKIDNANLNLRDQTYTDINPNNSPENKINNNLRSNTSVGINTKINTNNDIHSKNVDILGPSVTKIKNFVNQKAQNNAEFNINNSPGTRITNEQIIKQSVKINNQVNNIIKNNQINNIIRENTISAPRQPLTNLITLKLSNSTLSSGALLPLADVEPYRLIGGHITANLPSNFKQNIVLSQISDAGQILHAIILDFDHIPQSILDQNSLYETSLGSDISGTNPFTGNQDEVKIITNLFLWNNNPQPMIFNGTSGVTMNLIYK